MIRLIAFDFGGVFFHYDFHILMDSLSKELGIFKENLIPAYDSKELDNFTTGKCTEYEFWNSLLKKLNKQHDIGKLHDIVIDHFKPNPDMLQLVQRIRQKFKVALLTNQTTWLDELNEKYDFYKEFDYLIISKDEGVQKPDKRIFEILFERSGLSPDEILFIDNHPDYEKLVIGLGMKFIRFTGEEELERLLFNLRVL
ncbi:HAD family phosphatase [Candidatus Woesearchaeota archaeon]|nr:HAD family phosphatase [Candidatus Woesearchaeota archaeon]